MKMIVLLVVFWSGFSKALNVNEACITPCNTPGTCVEAVKCPYAISILRKQNATYQDSEYLSNSICGRLSESRSVPLICCPSLPNLGECGTLDIGRRIFGGDVTEHGQHPWAAVLIYNLGRNQFAPECSGSLINSRFVLTAAHCILEIPRKWKLQKVRFSEWNALKKANCTIVNDEKICRRDYAIESIIVHSDYRKKDPNRMHDIALVKLVEEVTFDKYVRPICLPMDVSIQELPIDSEEFTVTGWGVTETGYRSAVQLHVDLVGRSNTVCDKAYSPIGITLTDTHLCVGGAKGKDSCKGDSGGPLLRLVGTVWYQVGVVSFGSKFCGTTGMPGVYTNVAKHIDWIVQTVHESYCRKETSDERLILTDISYT
ncbi:CLIP domain-containing serine protease B15-like [Sabethes cyaneus]|uniref:CLIP domain-containing serine protease B15-like n=1 Tax=Sabethes cyaneus TaxID=53552 RepID=UPI00237E6781|nr:CLIP domain-containing serine protease B15-like [Sabethes cyaneus]